jgi:hypothetical protein
VVFRATSWIVLRIRQIGTIHEIQRAYDKINNSRLKMLSPAVYSCRLPPSIQSSLANRLQLVESLTPGRTQAVGFRSRLNPGVIHQQTRFPFPLILELNVD